MTGIKHATRRRFARVSTRSKTIETGISAQFTDYKRKLAKIATGVRALHKEVNQTKHVWSSVAKHQRDFSDALAAALPEDGMVRNHAKEVETAVHDIQRVINQEDHQDAPHERLASVLSAYLAIIDAIEADYPDVEVAYTEVVRYQRKVDKLEKKDKRSHEKLTRNLNKLTGIRAELDRKLEALIDRMRVAYDKHHVVFQCAHHAFWIANNAYAAAVSTATAAVRAESVATHPQLVSVDVVNVARIEPHPRVPIVTEAVQPLAIEDGKVTATVPTAVTTLTESEQLDDTAVVNMPVVPSEMPKPREKQLAK